MKKKKQLNLQYQLIFFIDFQNMQSIDHIYSN